MLLTECNKYRLLVLCTGNSARSIVAEALFNTLGRDFFEAYSAGSHPTGKVNPLALEQISQLPLPYKPRSKSWDEFSTDDAPILDIVLSVCGNAAQTICPHLPGNVRHVHWGLADPAAVDGSDDEKRMAFSHCFDIFQQRISRLISAIGASGEHGFDVAELMKQVALEDKLGEKDEYHAMA